MDQLLNTARLRIWIGGLVGLLVCIFALGLAYNLHTSPPIELRLAPTNTTTSYLSGESVYSYNGLAFSRTPVRGDGPTIVLSTGLKLPPIRFAQWAGDKGIFVAFAYESYLGSAPWRQLLNQGSSYSDLTADFLWYIRFSDNTLHLVDTSIPKRGVTHYSAVDNTLYYLSNSDNDEGGIYEPMVLRRYSIDRLQNDDVIKNGRFSYNDAIAVTACKGYVVCLYGIYETTSSRVYGITQSGESRAIYETRGYVGPTNRSDIISIAQPVRATGNEDEQIELRFSLYNLSKKSLHRTNLITNSLYARAVMTSDTTFYVVSPGSQHKGRGTTVYRGGTNIFGGYRTSEKQVRVDGKNYTGVIVSLPSTSTSGDALFYDDAKNSVLITHQTASSLKSTSYNEVKRAVEGCMRYGVVMRYFSDTKTFRIYVNDDVNFDESIRNLSQCLTKTNPQQFLEYTFYFGGVSPKNGRFTTD